MGGDYDGHGPAPKQGCECMQCHWERHLIENGRRGENRENSGEESDLFGHEELKEERREQRRGDRWLERHGHL